MSTLIRYFCAVILTCAAVAQPAPTSQPDIEIDASVKAKSVRFEQVPNVKVTFPGDSQKDTQWTGSRGKLPRPVKAGVTYKDVSATTHIRSTFRDVLRALEARP